MSVSVSRVIDIDFTLYLELLQADALYVHQKDAKTVYGC